MDFVRELKVRDWRVLILSNNFKERTEYYRKNFAELFEAVDGAYFSWETGFVKSSEDAYTNILNKEGVDAEDTYYFDDSSTNVDVASGLGINAYKYEGIEQVGGD